VAKTIKCDAIFPGCTGVVRAETEAEVMRLAAEHAQQVHGVDQIDDATARKVQAAIVSD
jgi:predicted small metal-binding protein